MIALDAGRHFGFDWNVEFWEDGEVIFDAGPSFNGGNFWVFLAQGTDKWYVVEAGGEGDRIWDIDYEGEWDSPLRAMLEARKINCYQIACYDEWVLKNMPWELDPSIPRPDGAD